MKAALLTRPGEIVMDATRPEPEPGSGDVVVEMTGIGICGSDLSAWSGQRPADYPWIIGHEGTGRIVAAGSEISGDRVGERVVIEPNYPCLACGACRAGRTSICPHRAILGVNTPGLLAERAVVPARFAWTAPDDLTDPDLVCVEPMAVALHAARTGQAAAGTRCLVVGAGSQGLLLLLTLRAIGASVGVTETHEGRLEAARAMGAEAPSGDPYDLVFETSGSAGGTRHALTSLAPGGTLVLIGLPHGDVPMPTSAIVRGHAVVRGSIIYDHPVDFPDTLAFIADRALQPSLVLRRTFAFEDSPTALAEAGSVPGKSWIKF